MRCRKVKGADMGNSRESRRKPIIRWRGPQQEGNWTRVRFLRYAREFPLVEDRVFPEFCLAAGYRTDDFWYCLGHKLLLSAENVRPDFEFYDWAQTFAKRSARNLRIDPNFLVPPALASDVAHNQGGAFVRDPVQCLQQKTKFCAFVASNVKCATRNHFFELLSRHRLVDARGTMFRTGPNALPRFWPNVSVEASQFYRPYKFVMVFENSLVPGYTSEKLWLPLHAQSVPIYWGNPRVADYFHPDCFINAFDFDSLESLVQHVLRVDKDDELYLRYLSAPRLTARQKAALHRDEQRTKTLFADILYRVTAGSASVTQQLMFPREFLSRVAPAALAKHIRRLQLRHNNRQARGASRRHIWPHRAFYDALHMPGDAVPET